MKKASRAVDVITGIVLLVYAIFSSFFVLMGLFFLFTKKEALGLTLWQLASFSIFCALFFYLAMIFFQQNKEGKHIKGLIVLLVWWIEGFFYRFFFVTNHKLEATDFLNLLLFIVPAIFILLGKYLYQKNTSSTINNV